MQSRNPMLDTYRKLTAQVIANVDPVLPKPPAYYLRDEKPPKDSIPPKVELAWRPLPEALAQIDAQVSALGEAVFKIATDKNLNEFGKCSQISKQIDLARTTVDALSTQVLDSADRIMNYLRTAAFPARPGTADATQEAALAGIKSDLRMVLDPVTSDDDLIVRLTDQLGRALADNNALTTWLLASSHWPEDYLISRRADLKVTHWQSIVAETLDTTTPADIAKVRRAYQVVSDPQTGLPVLSTLLGGFLGQILTDAARDPLYA
ncbi:MAG: hypothetical protein JWN96_290 [Mycobacterium sp.]|nr:hypothetical protein [Mycobacterium sp.]